VSGTGSQIDSSTTGEGPGGGIELVAPTLSLDDGGQIATRTEGPGPAGELVLRLRDLEMQSGSQITTESRGVGDAGGIRVFASGNVELFGDSRIRADAESAFGGSIAVNADRLEQDASGRLVAVKPSESAPRGVFVRLVDSEISTSVVAGIGNGGNVVIEPVAIVLQNSRITANALGEGDGGNILLVADAVFSDLPLEEALQASSQRGVSGSVEVRPARRRARPAATRRRGTTRAGP
jgi:hypothetical protein